jgi:uncharacterized membrane protein
VGAVAALREGSMVFALAIGSMLLRERMNLRRCPGVAAMLTGAVSLRA